jgi:radical SAM protein with 4Fe4S-binding SPASM domain
MSALFELTLRCNMRCIHCGSSAGVQRPTELSTEQWSQVIQQLSEMNCRFIGLLGGEPFVRNDWFTIAQTIKEYGMDFSIMTNAALINDVLISKLRRLDPYDIVVSIDGGTAATHDSIRQTKGSFDQCIRALHLLRQAGISRSVITTVNKKNISELPLLRSLLINKEIAWQIQLAVPIGRFPRELLISPEEFYSVALFIATTRQKYSLKELPIAGAHCIGYHSSIIPPIMLLPFWNGCPAGVTTVGIQSDGGVKGCLSLSDEFIEGNIQKRNISDIWDNPASFSYNRRFKKNSLCNGCRGCKYGRTCKGGCLSVSTSTAKAPHADPYCLYLFEKNEKKNNVHHYIY